MIGRTCEVPRCLAMRNGHSVLRVAVQRTVWRVGAVIVGLSTIAVALPTLAVSERKCCDVRLRDNAGRFTASGETTTVTATMAARRQGCTKLRPRLTVSLSGLEPDEIRVERVVRGRPRSLSLRSGGAGVVQAREPVRDGPIVCGDDQVDLAYRLTFLAGSPTGQATLSAVADTPSGRVLGRDVTVTAVVDNGVAPPPVQPPTPPAAPPSAVDSPPPAAADRPSTAADRLSSTLVATGLAVVVAATVAMVAVLVLRSRRRELAAPVAPAGAAGTDGLPDLPRRSRQPTLADRWSSVAAAMRRSSGPVDKER
jgi:hypothetical protein